MLRADVKRVADSPELVLPGPRQEQQLLERDIVRHDEPSFRNGKEFGEASYGNVAPPAHGATIRNTEKCMSAILNERQAVFVAELSDAGHALGNAKVVRHEHG